MTTTAPASATAPAFVPGSTRTADRDQLARFLDALFRYADDGTYISWRAFPDTAAKTAPVFVESSQVTTPAGTLVADGAHWATKAARSPEPSVFCPPIATFDNPTKAREVDLANGLALSVECDRESEAARVLLESVLGPATVVVASGGQWTDAGGTVHPKLHLHWRLSEPTTTPEQHATLKRARTLATTLVGGDVTNKPTVHPIRWPGSWHRKGTPRLAEIVGGDADREIELTDALDALTQAAAAHGITAPVATTAIVPPSEHTTAGLIAQVLSGKAIHAPLVSLAFRYVGQGMPGAAVVNTLRGFLDAIPPAARGDDPARWQGHYDDIPRTVRTAEAKGVRLPAPGGILESVAAFAEVAAAQPRRIALMPSGTASRPVPPAELLTPPGVLGDVAAYGLATSVRPVPAFAVQAALALGSVICARRYVTTRRNYASLYFLNVGKSGTGKEEAKTTIEAILTAADARRLVGGSTYSSGNAVYSALLKKPQHLAIVDEFGKYMEGATAAKDNHRGDVLTMFMEAFGRVHADMSTPQFSTMTMRAQHAAEVEPRIIVRPAITLLALTTPSSFYGALTSTRVLDGFLNRFLVAEHTGPREPAREADAIVEVPARVVSWVRQALAPRGDLDDLFQLDTLPDPVIVPLTAAALARSNHFEREMLKRAEQLEPVGLGDMPIRTREIGLRLGLVCALADALDTPTVTDDVLDWAFRYVQFYLEQTVDSLRERLADSEHERTRNRIYTLIRDAGARGVTDVEFNKKPFVGVGTSRRERNEVRDALLTAEEIAWIDVPHPPGKAGRPRRAMVAIAAEDSSESSIVAPGAPTHADAA